MTKPVILIVEREQSLRHGLGTMLFQRGFDVIEATDKMTAMQCFHKKIADLVLVDASLDVPWDGIEVAQYIRRRSSKTLLILITSQGCEDLAIAALRAKVDDYFKQPFSLDTVVASICRLCERSAAACAVTGPVLVDDQRMIGYSVATQGIKAYIRSNRSRGLNLLIYYGLKEPKFRNCWDFSSALQANLLIWRYLLWPPT